mgnify:CR=1 FL=1
MGSKSYKDIIRRLDEGRNILITGSGGVGKTFSVEKLYEHIKNNTKKEAYITAMTGAASLQYTGATTIHRLTGIGIAKTKLDVREAMSKHWFIKNNLPILISMDVIIIDEISMMRSDTLELVNYVFQEARDNFSEPFGGVQVVFCGDMMQLPPVVKNDETLERPWCFQSPIWEQLNIETVNLTKVYRQDDEEFIKNLNWIRTGICKDHVEEYFKNTVGHMFGDIKPIRLVATNNEVNLINITEINKVDSDPIVFKSIRVGDDRSLTKLSKDCPAEDSTVLKYGCQVVILKNGQDYVNGSMGTYVGECSIELYDQLNKRFKAVKALKIELSDDKIVKVPVAVWELSKTEIKDVFDDETCTIKKERVKTVIASITQFPVKLGYAITTHRSQGMSLDYVQIDFLKFFADGQAYVALSRARSYEGLRCLNFNKNVVRANGDAFNFYLDLKNKGEI